MQGNNPGEPPEQDCQQNCPKRSTPREAVRYANISIQRLAHQGGPVEALPLEFPDSSPGVIIIYKVGGKNACTHIFSLIHCAVRDFSFSKGFRFIDRSERNFLGCSKEFLCEVEEGYTIEKCRKIRRDLMNSFWLYNVRYND